MKEKILIKVVLFAALIFTLGFSPSDVLAANPGLEFKAYEYDEVNGVGNPLSNNSVVNPGDFIQLDVYWIQGPNTGPTTLQLIMNYDAANVEPAWGGAVDNYDMKPTIPNGGMWPSKNTPPPTNIGVTNWVIMESFPSVGEFRALIYDSVTQKPLQVSGKMFTTWFQVKSTATPLANLPFTFLSGPAGSNIDTGETIDFTNINLKVFGVLPSNGNLSSLTVDQGTLTPIFDKDTTNYTVTVPNTVNNITLAATPEDSLAIVSGDTGTKSLIVGANTFTISVTAQDGSIKNYNVTVTRNAPLSSNTNLNSLSLTYSNSNSITLNPSFSGATKNYTATVLPGTTSVLVNYTKAEAAQTVLVTGNTNLVVGPNTINVMVTAEDGTIDNYVITVTRPASTDATLSALNITGYNINPVFNSATTAYTANVPNSVASLTVNATTTDSKATYNVTGNTSLSTGANTINILVTAEDGITTKTYAITVTRATNNDATLSALSISGYSISPSFNSGTTSYTASVPNTVTAVTVNATTTDIKATYNVTGNTSLSAGTNTINILVTAEDGTTTKTYTITVTKAANNDATLSALSISGYNINPVFNSTTTSYTATVPNNITSVTVNATTTDIKATHNVTGNTSLNTGTNTVNVIVTAEDGTTTKTYTIAVTRQQSSNTNLNGLSLEYNNTNPITINPTFNSATKNYTATVLPGTTSIVVNYTKAETAQTVLVTGNTALTVGPNTVNVMVTAEDGTVDNYVITVTKPVNMDATLSALSISGYSISPSFNSATTNYSVTVPNTDTSVVVNATPTDSNANYNVTGDTGLTVGINTVSVIVTAEDGTTTKTYTITVTRSLSNVSTLDSLVVKDKGGNILTLNPTFTKLTNNYTINTPVAHNNDQIKVEYIKTDSTSTVTIKNETTNQADNAGVVDLNTGANVIAVSVISADSSITLVYKVTVTRLANNDATLSALSISGYSITPTFNSTTTTYTASVPNSVTSVTVNATPTDSNATYNIIGNTSLSTGSNTIDVVVTAADGTTTKTYTINVTKAANNDATLNALSLSGYSITPSFNSTTTTYTASVPNNITSVTVNATPTDSNATHNIIGNTSLNVGTNNVDIVVTAEDGTTTKTYTITVTRQQSSNTNLTGLSLEYTNNDPITINPTFSSATKSYTATVLPGTTDINVNYTKAETAQSVVITGETGLVVGPNTVTVTVTAEDGSVDNYIITVTKPLNNDATLSALSISGYTLTPTFSSTTTSYSVTVPNTDTSVSVSATPTDSNATHNITGGTGLNVGTNTVDIVVTAEDGTTTKTYTITVTRSNASTSSQITSVTFGHTIDATYVYSVKDVTDKTTLLTQFDNNPSDLKLYDSTDTSEYSDPYVGTGSILKLIQGTEQDRKIIIVLGDITGDGLIDSFDAMQIIFHYLGTTTLSGTKFIAADTTKSGSVDSFDAMQIVFHYLGTSSIVY